ncbi:MAG TPA: NAD-dependent epimerase/dehydratase family protein [Cyclobacteriaceae bacterium]
MKHKTAFIVGATGLVGKALLNLLFKEKYYDRIIVLTRRPIDIKEKRLEELIIKNFDLLDQYKDWLTANDYYCCLGTSLKKAGSHEEFRKVDLEYPLKIASIAEEHPSFESFMLVSSVAANPNSAATYNRVKGELEQELRKLNLNSLHIFRASLLVGPREEYRPGEIAARLLTKILSFFIIGWKRNFALVKAEEVAKAMFNQAKNGLKGIHVYRPARIRKISQ